jgi:hypothetical protein
MLCTTHMDARTDRIQTYPFLCTPTIQIEEDLIRANIYERYAIKWEKDHPGHRAHTQMQRYERVIDVAYCDSMMNRIDL